MNLQIVSIMDMPVFHVRVDKIVTPENWEYGYYSFYNVMAPNKHDAGEKARKQFAEDFGPALEDTEVGYIWDAGVHVDLKRKPAI